MTNTSPAIGRNGSINIAGLEIGYMKGVSFDLTASLTLGGVLGLGGE